ncbi:hypothetical protein SNE40_003928 [Patella caerulea]|uniref:peptidylprolyl isomerase n=1 Tax=Patella caerulea TaxID=87958 RepID=A0AAN8K8W7_PATCE
MNTLYPDDEPTVTLTNGIDLNDLRNPNTNGVEFEVQDESKDKEEDTDVYQVFNQDDVFKNMYQDDYSLDEEEMDTFERIKLKMSDISSGDGGVMKRILNPGSGNVVTPESLVRVHYNLYLEGSDEPFDSTRLRGEVFKFRLGQGMVITGLEIAVSSMKKGEKSQYIFTPDYGYGKMGCGNRIPGNSAILAEVELMSFVEQEGVDDFYNMTEIERKNITLEQILKVCRAHKDDGKACFQAKQYQKSFTRYKKAVDVLEMYHLKNEKEEESQQKMLLKLYLNLSLCCLNLCHSGRAISYCKKVLELDKNNCKALFRFGKALRQVSEFDRARNYYRRAQKLEPHNKEINHALVELDK